MRSDPQYTGPFKELIPQFILFKRSQGYDYGYPAVMRLREIDLFMQANGVLDPVITEETHLKWCARRAGEALTNQARRISALSVFEKWLVEQRHMKGIYVDRAGSHKHFRSDFLPYIFSSEDIIAMFRATEPVDGDDRVNHNIRTLASMLALYYGCGLRKSEAQKLTWGDIDFETGKIRILDSKNHASRIVMASGSIMDRLKKLHGRCHGHAENARFFHDFRGRPFSDNLLYSLFHQVLREAGIRRPDNGRMPRIHDLRHTYAVRALEAMEHKGFDLYVSLPLLSKSMGHRHIVETEYYLRMREEHFAEILDKVQKHSPKLAEYPGGEA